MYDVLGCLFLDWYLMLDFDVFFLLVLDSNMFMYNIVTCWDKKKKTCFRGKKCSFLGLAMVAS
jgi:hypothetical protein